ncbi:MAG: hypothetical protein RL518_480 [Pseudomonadota bacterium]|jgi:uncharacterized protein YecE (DUF72 family)
MRELTTTASAEDIWSPEGARLPDTLYLGTSTWAFPGWKGLVYRRPYKSQKDFTANSLGEYATIPWFRTVCVDSFFYNPPKPETLQHYASLVPESFRWVSKVWERLTIATYPRHPRYGANAGRENPDFLNMALLQDAVLAAYRDPAVMARTGPLVFQFAPFSERTMRYRDFIDRLAEFLRRLPQEFQYAVEVRNPELLQEGYFQALNEARVAHCFNHWNSMVPLHQQMRAAAESGGLTADFYIARLLTPLGTSYQNAEELFEPYDRVQAPNAQMRGDVLRIVRRALSTKRRAFVTANNKAEGNSPLTMVSIGRLIVEREIHEVTPSS